MNKLVAAGVCVVAAFLGGCAADATADATGSADGELRAQLGENDAIRCTAASKHLTFAVVPTKDGKGSLLSLKPAADLFALSRAAGSVTSSSTGVTWKSSKASLTIGADMKGTWESGSQSANVTCEKAEAAEAASWRAANGLADYADEIDGIADTVVGEDSKASHPKPYMVFAVETSRRGSLALGKVVANSAGKVSSNANEDSQLDENDFSYGAMSAAYSLGGGDDYGEWFQGVSDGVSLVGDLSPTLGANTVAGYIAHEEVSALSSLVDHANPSAVEITVGPWTFFLPDAFAK
jgi:hypothetical protein